MEKQFNLKVLLFQDGNIWIAQCLNYDIVAQGNTLKSVQEAFEKTFIGQVLLDIEDNKNPLEDIEPAPKEFWEKFNLYRDIISPIEKDMTVKNNSSIVPIIILPNNENFEILRKTIEDDMKFQIWNTKILSSMIEIWGTNIVQIHHHSTQDNNDSNDKDSSEEKSLIEES